MHSVMTNVQQQTAYQNTIPKYKLLDTGGNSVHVSSKMKYANFVQNKPQFDRYPILTLKQPATGLPDIVKSASVNTVYVKNMPLSKIYCIQYGGVNA